MTARAWLFRRWYAYINRIDVHAELRFLNYGWANGDRPVPLEPADEPSRWCIHLYRHLADAAGLEGRDVVEIGCGRGGGLSYIARTYRPATALGVDLEPGAVSFCRHHYREPGLAFVLGDAHDLPLRDGSCDVVLNLESSHRYRCMSRFLAETRRILRPRGVLVLADFRHRTELPALERELGGCGLRPRSEEDITGGVVRALRRDDARRRRLVRQMIPWFARRPALDFAGAVGTPTFRQFASREMVYRQYVFDKA
jgi:ubiquinone/menaquinone biosynthesis C-methylase UbiE